MSFKRSIPVPFSSANSEQCKSCGHDNVVDGKVQAIMPVISEALAELIPKIKVPFTECHLSAKANKDTIIITIKCPKADTQASI